MQYTLQKLLIIQISTQQQVLRVNQMKTGRFESLNIFCPSISVCYFSHCFICFPLVSYLLVGPWASLTLLPSAKTTYPVTTAPLENPEESMVTGIQVSSSVPSWGPASTWTFSGGSGTPV